MVIGVVQGITAVRPTVAGDTEGEGWLICSAPCSRSGAAADWQICSALCNHPKGDAVTPAAASATMGTEPQDDPHSRWKTFKGAARATPRMAASWGSHRRSLWRSRGRPCNPSHHRLRQTRMWIKTGRREGGDRGRASTSGISSPRCGSNSLSNSLSNKRRRCVPRKSILEGDRTRSKSAGGCR